MTRNPKEVLTSILSGALSSQAMGFIVAPPKGYTLDRLVRKQIAEAYGAEHHPDVRILAPDGAGDMIKVSEVRDSQPFLASSPSGDRMKTLVVLRAHRMNPSSQNAMLKPLEEPTRHTRILLVTDNPSGLLPTIRSRCSFHVASADDALAREEVLSRLEEGAKLPDAEKLSAVLDMACGDPGLAARIHQHGLEKWITEVRSWLSGNDPTPPLPVLTGKTATPLEDATLALQSLLSRMMCEQISLKGWSLARAANAAWTLSELMTDIHRSGIDARTRMHSALISIRQAPAS